MILGVFLFLMGVGVLASAGMMARPGATYAPLASTAVWLVVAYGASDLSAVSGGETVTVGAEPAVSVLAFGNAFISVVVLLATLTGHYSAEDSADEMPAQGEVIR